MNCEFVVPAEAGNQTSSLRRRGTRWIPAFAGMTGLLTSDAMPAGRQERPATSDEKGFTLIELLISLTIFSLVAVVIYSSFYLGIRTWRKNEADLNTYQMVDFCFNRIRKDFGRIVNPVYTGSGEPNFSGSAKGVSFLILSPISPFENPPFIPPLSKGDIGGLNGDLRITRVKYFVGARHDVPVLIRNEQRLTRHGGQASDEIELLDDAAEIKFSYRSSDGGWSSGWAGKNLPRSVKIDFKGYSKVFFIQIDSSL
ncbi:MAG: prepilin-type N-terminal cleavage/methylation domain-containing protein [bacterium]